MIKIFDQAKIDNPKSVYKITHQWMLGDADGDTTTEQLISKDNPFIDKFLECCHKLTIPLPNTWGNSLELDTIKKCLKNDYEFFKQFINEGTPTEDENIEELYFSTIIEQGATFVTYQGFNLVYYDENGIKFKCEWIESEKTTS